MGPLARIILIHADLVNPEPLFRQFRDSLQFLEPQLQVTRYVQPMPVAEYSFGSLLGGPAVAQGEELGQLF